VLHPRYLVVLFALAIMEASAALGVGIGIGFVSTAGPFLGPEVLFLWAAIAGVIASVLAAVYGRVSWAGRLALAAGAIVSVILPAVLTTSGTGGAAALLLALGAVYWRGIAVVMAEPEAEDIVFRFTMGLGIFTIGCVVLTARGMMFQPRVAGLVTVAGVIFVLAALSALAAASLRRSTVAGATASSIAAVCVYLAIVAALALAGYRLVTSHVGGTIATILSPIWDAITYGIAFFLTLLLRPLFALIQRTHFRLPRMPVISTPNTLGHRVPTPVPRKTPQVFISHSTDALLTAIVIGIAILALVAIIWRTAAAISGRKGREEGGEEREPVEWSPADIWRGLLAWFRGLFRGTVEAAAHSVQVVRSRIGGPSYPADPVRRVYAQVLYRASVYGLARPPAATPLEFQRALSSRWPEGANEFAAVTEAYIRRRYGEMTSGQEEVATLREQWQQLRTVMRRPRPAS
jgi:multisubunit Na+/H+ antiporter MnhC subunit